MHSATLPGITVTMRVDGSNLTEHNTLANDNSTTTEAYTEATPGAIFSFKVTRDAGFAYRKEDLRIVVELDGLKTNTCTISGAYY